MPFLEKLVSYLDYYHHIPYELAMCILKYMSFDEALQFQARNKELLFIGSNSPPKVSTNLLNDKTALYFHLNHSAHSFIWGKSVSVWFDCSSREFYFHLVKSKDVLLDSLLFQRYDFNMLSLLAALGRIDLLKLLDQFHPELLANNSKVTEFAARAGHLDCLQYLVSNVTGVSVTRWAITRAAARGHFEVVEYLHSQKERIQKKGSCAANLSCDYAAKNGKFKVLKFLLENGYVFSEGAFIFSKNSVIKSLLEVNSHLLLE